MSFQFRPAERSNTIPLIGFYGESGTGKTFSALLVARGIVGPKGRIGMIDTETGRGALYADQIPGGYEIGQLDTFAPGYYVEAIEAFEKAGVDIIIIDSASHEWEGIGGVCDMAAASEARTKKAGLHNWIKPKAEHKKFMQKLLRTKVPVIICLRSKYKTKQIKVNGKTEVVKDDFTSPIQDGSFIFEMTAHLEVLQDHSIRLTKCSHPDLKTCFPTKGPITINTGEKIASWGKGGVAPEPAKAEPKPTKRAKPSSVETDPYQEALDAADKGIEALQSWWTGPGRPHQKYLSGRLDELKEYAKMQELEPEPIA